MGTRVIKFEAPEGKVYDWAEPHIATIIDEKGNKTEEQEHLYANVLFLSKFDTIENYKLVDTPRED